MEWGISEFAKKVGVSIDTLRYYEKEGIIVPARTESGYRRYNEKDLDIMKNVLVMKYAHFTLAEMKNMEDALTKEPDANCNGLTKVFIEGKITQLELAISNYKKIVALMKALLPMIDNADAYDCDRSEIDKYINTIFDGISEEK